MITTGDKLTEKGEKIIEWRRCVDPQHLSEEKDFYITEGEKKFFELKVEQGEFKELKLPTRCLACRRNSSKNRNKYEKRREEY
jgi:hypothetical protein